MSEPAISPQWLRREPPLRVAGALVDTSVAPTILRRLARAQIDPQLRVSHGDAWLLLVGPASGLPWAEGVTWLGRDGPLFTPTTLRPDLPADLVARVLHRSVDDDAFCVATPPRCFVAPIPPAAPDPSTLMRLAEQLAPGQALR